MNLNLFIIRLSKHQINLEIKTNKIMKKLALISVVLVGALAFTSCQQDPDGFNDASLEELDISSEVAAESSLEDVDLIAEAGMETLAESANGRVWRDEILQCAEVTKDTVNRTLIIDFGEGCEGANGVVRSGKIIIEYNQRRYMAGAYRVMTFEGFFVDSVQIEGTRKLLNTTDSTSTLQFEATLTGGKLTFPDGTSYTRDAAHIRRWIRTQDREDDYASLTGEAEGTNRNGEQYHIKVIEELVFSRRCRRGRIIVPIAGIIQKVVGDKIATIDFGDGECDNIATITIDGETKRFQVYPRGRRLY